MDGPVAPRLGHLLLDELGKVLEDFEIGVDLGLDTGAADLEDHRRAAGELGPMHLRDRGGGIGLTLEIDKHFERRPAERLFELRQKIIERNRRHVAVQPLELSRSTSA